MLVYHITTKDEWDHAQETGVYDRSTRGKSFNEVGFIHASQRNQVEDVAKFVYLHCDEPLVVLVMNLQSLEAAGLTVRFEDGGNGQMYPHIYAPILSAIVMETRPAKFGDTGNFVF